MLLARDPVEHVPLEMRMAVGDAGVIEIARDIARHADPLHNGRRSVIVRHGERNDLPQAARAEAEV